LRMSARAAAIETVTAQARTHNNRMLGCAEAALWVHVGLAVIYLVVVLQGNVYEHALDYAARREFLRLPGIEAFPFLADEIARCQAIVARGLFLPAFSRWIESKAIYRLLTLESPYTAGAFFLLVAYIVRRTFDYLSNRD